MNFLGKLKEILTFSKFWEVIFISAVSMESPLYIYIYIYIYINIYLFGSKINKIIFKKNWTSS